MVERTTIEKFKKATREVYRGYPLYEFWGVYERELGTEKLNKIFPYLIEDKILREVGRIPNTNQPKYMLSHNGLNLVSQWNVERLTKWIIVLTIGLFVLGLAQFFI